MKRVTQIGESAQIKKGFDEITGWTRLLQNPFGILETVGSRRLGACAISLISGVCRPEV